MLVIKKYFVVRKGGFPVQPGILIIVEDGGNHLATELTKQQCLMPYGSAAGVFKQRVVQKSVIIIHPDFNSFSDIIARHGHKIAREKVSLTIFRNSQWLFNFLGN